MGNDLKKVLIINHTDLAVVAIGNFDVTAQTISVTFPSAGTWYNYLAGGTFAATGAAQAITLQPGEYKVYTNQNIPGGVVLTPPPTPPTPSGTKLMVQANPNPFGTAGIIKYIVPSTGVVNIVLLNSLGQKCNISSVLQNPLESMKFCKRYF
ncbi:MAG: hypothetical protein IPP48_15875 [Chitinophagaceae bacterium]|nr:hypothetical protein [Chitinophagaceae bacterium]